jgi:hypothetical protein
MKWLNGWAEPELANEVSLSDSAQGRVRTLEDAGRFATRITQAAKQLLDAQGENGSIISTARQHLA